MILRFVNTMILALTIILTLTGVYGLIFAFSDWVYDAHRISGWALIALIPWKAQISWRSISRGLRPSFKRSWMIGISLLLAALALTTLIYGLFWAWRAVPEILWLYQTAISWHWILAFILLIPFTVHVLVRWPRPKWEDFTSRRAALRLIGLTLAGVGGWQIAEALARAQATSEAPRAVTGSRGTGFYTANNFFITGEWANEVDAQLWRLTVVLPGISSPSTLTYDQLLKLPRAEQDVTIDCTTGWYSRQKWLGTPVMALLNGAQLSAQIRAVAICSTTGYAQSFLIEEARNILLSTHVGGQILDHWHGYPLRAVVPSRRGWFWVKWINRIEFLDSIPLDFPDFR